MDEVKLQRRVPGKFNAFKKTRTAKILKALLNFLLIVTFLFFAFIVFLALMSKSTGEVVKIGPYQVYSVIGGSMEPAIHKGSIIIVSHPGDKPLKVNDIVTFLNPGDKKTVVTHRIVNINNKGEEITYTTRGDANERDDIDPLPRNHILGKEHLTLPLIGNIMIFAKTKTGLIVMVIIPGILLILSEMLNLRKLYKQQKKQKEELLMEKLKQTLINTSSEGGNNVT